MHQNTDQKISEYGYFLRSVKLQFSLSKKEKVKHTVSFKSRWFKERIIISKSFLGRYNCSSFRAIQLI